MKLKSAAIEFYLDWVNNYLSVDKMASDYGMDVLQVHYLIRLGKEWHEENVSHYKQFGELKYPVEGFDQC